MIILNFKSLQKKNLFFYITFLKKLLCIYNLKYNFFFKKKKKKKIILLKSPHVYKKAKEHFIQNTYSIHLKINNILNKNIIKILFLNKPSTIQCKIKILI